MSYLLQPYAVLLLSAVGISAALAITVLRYRPTLGTRSFAVLMTSIAFWAFLNLLEVVAQDLPTKQFSGNVKYVFIVAVPVAWLTFALYYANRIKHLRPAHLAMLSIVPLLTLAMTATNEAHHLMFESIEWRRSQGMILPLRHFGPWFWVHTAYSYTLLFLGFLFLARTCVDSQRIYRRQAISLLIAALTPWLCNIFFLTGANPLPYLDLTPFAFTISGLAVMLGILRYRLLDIVPVARDLVIQNMNDGIIVVDNQHRILDLNPIAADLAGGDQRSLVGRRGETVIPWWPRFDDAADTSEGAVAGVIEIERAGRVRQVQMHASVLCNKGRCYGRILLLRDITDIREAQEAMRRSEDRFKAISENAPVIILSLDESGTITYVNPSWKIILGHARDDVIGRPFTQFVENSVRSYDDLFDRLMNGSERVAEGHIQFRHRDQSKRVFNFTASVNSDSEGRITGIILVAKDITEEERLKTELFQSQKMEAIGTLAGGIAHDFNNLLMGMQANISLLYIESEDNAVLQEKLKRIEDQIACGASLTRQLLGYARKGKYVVAPRNVHTLIDDALQVVERANKQIRVQRFLAANPSILEADQGQMDLVFLNLFVNAADAMPKGGDLTVSTRLAPHQELAGDWPDLKPGHYIEIKVSDTGAGMDQSTQERIFEPFFTTKEIGRGTGLGLASVYGVVKNHDGHIQVQSRIGQGTTFTLLFQAAAGPPGAPAGASLPASAAVRRGGHILLVDGEPHVLTYLEEMIESLGFLAFSSGNEQEAQRIFEKHHQLIDVVMVDTHLSGAECRDFFRRLHDIKPQIRVVRVGDGGREEEAENIYGQVRQVNLQKPFTRADLAQAFARVLGDPDTYPRNGPAGNSSQGSFGN